MAFCRQRADAKDPVRADTLTDEECVTVKYINAKEVLPEQLLMQLQEYVQGKMIYIPGKDAERAAWGEANGTRAEYRKRNREIMSQYRSGIRVDELAQRYHLSPCSIRKIVHGKAGHELLGQCIGKGISA
jgi:Mor family transcriptional regulator